MIARGHRGARVRAPRYLLAVVPLALVASGCFATRDDVRVLQDDLRTMREEQLRADSAQLAALERLTRRLEVTGDSLTELSARLTRFQGVTRADLYNLGQQLIQVQELTGQSQARILELRAQLEQRAREEAAAQQQAPAGAVPPSGTATPPRGTRPAPAGAGTTPPAAPAAQTPGPAELLQLSLDQLRRGAAGSARRSLEELLRSHPQSDLVPQATFYLGEAYAAEGNLAAADSVYVQVAERYPRATEAATALYKHGVFLEDQGRADEAQRVFREVVRRFPRSDAATLARSRLPG